MTATFTLGLGAGIARAQKLTGPVPLGDIARQLRMQRAKSANKPRVFTNDDLIALRTPGEQAPPSLAGSSSTSSTEANPAENLAQPTSVNQTGQEAAHATPERVKETGGKEDYIDRMSEVQVVLEGQRKDAKTSPPAAKLVKHPAPSPDRARPGQVRQGASTPTGEWAKAKFRIDPEAITITGKFAKDAAPSPGHALPGAVGQDAASAPTGEWAKARFRAVPGVVSSEPGPIAAPVISLQPSPRQDIGYVERANGRVEAIVAEGEHIGLVQETEAFVKSFHIPAPSPAELEAALASPPPTNPPDSPSPVAEQADSSSAGQDASGSQSAAGGVDVAALQQPEPPQGDNGEPQSEASATLQSEPLADYAGDQSRPKPPETLQPSTCPVPPASAPDVGTNRSTVRPIGYVEKAGGEKEAIVEFLDQVYLVHEGELFADKYRVLRVTPTAVEIVEERTEASSAALDRRRNIAGDPPPDSR
jgi:hypothetical protein